MSVHFAQVVFDCKNAAELAQFWSKILESPVDPDANPFFASIGLASKADHHPAFMFVQVPEDRIGKNRVHVDLRSPDRESDIQRAIRAGARRIADFEEYGTAWTTLTDPEGNYFDIGRGMN